MSSAALRQRHPSSSDPPDEPTSPPPQQAMSGKERIPWKTVGWAVFLLVLGLSMFVAGLVLWRVEGSGAFIGMFVLGLLVFIPGFFYTRIAYLAYRQRAGYTWEDLPEFPQYADAQ